MTGNAPPPQSQPAAQSLPERSRNSGQRSSGEHAAHGVESHYDGLERLFVRAGQQVPDFTTISLRLPNPPANALTFSIDRGNGGRPDLRSQLTLDRATRHRTLGGFLQLQQRTTSARVGAIHSHRGSWRADGADNRGHCVCWCCFAGGYRAFAWSATVPGLEGAAGQGSCPHWFLGNPVFSLWFSVLSLFAFCSPGSCPPCYNALPYGSAELLGPQKRISIVVLKSGVFRTGNRPGVPGSAGWKTPRS